MEILITPEVMVVIGAGGLGLAIALRQGFGKTVLLTDFYEGTLEVTAKGLGGMGCKVSIQRSRACCPESVQPTG